MEPAGLLQIEGNFRGSQIVKHGLAGHYQSVTL